MKGAPLKVLTAQLKANPQAAKEKNRDGDLPLHLAAAGGAPLEVVTALLKASPQAAKEMNSKGELPLHIAVARSAPNCVEALLKAHPLGVLWNSSRLVKDASESSDEVRELVHQAVQKAMAQLAGHDGTHEDHAVSLIGMFVPMVRACTGMLEQALIVAGLGVVAYALTNMTG